MNPHDAEHRLRERLAGVDMEDPDAVLDAFCACALEPTEPFEAGGETWRVGDHEDCDLLLHESGPSTDWDERGHPEVPPYTVWLTRQFSFEDANGEYAGMNSVTLQLRVSRLPEGRVPRAQRWGYAGPRREDVSDDEHPEMQSSWAGHVPTWAAAVRASRSWAALVELGVDEIVVSQSDI